MNSMNNLPDCSDTGDVGCSSGKNRLAVVYVCDKDYHDLTLYSLASFALHHSAALHFYIFQDGYETQVPSATQRWIEDRGHKIFLRDARGAAVPEFATRERHARDYISDTALLKASAVEELARNYEFVAYVDSDILVLEDPRLHAVAGFDELCAGVLDYPMLVGFENKEFSQNCSRHELSPKYINTGFFMVNAAKWQSVCFVDRYVHAVNHHNQSCIYLSKCVLRDQCPFNIALEGDVQLLPLAYNVQRWALYSRQWENAKIRHYTGGKKFLAPSSLKTDRKEDKLMKELERINGMPPRQKRPVDFGTLYRLNKLRRKQDIKGREDALEELASMV